MYLRGGYCKVHKSKGIKKTSQSRNTVRGEDGKLVTKYTKKTYYVCDINLTGGGRLRQQGLNFPLKTTLEDNPSQDD